MFNTNDSNSIFGNLNKIVSTFIPADSRQDQENNQLLMSIGAKSHGTITFSDNKSNRAEFIRIPPDAPIMQVKQLIRQQWCSARPSLVISITGGAKDYHMKPKLLRAFRRGLLKVARTTGAWIITGGMNTGIMKLVGEIVQINPNRSRPIHLIGIAPWGCVSGCQQLDVHGENVQYTKPRLEQKGEAPIEPNHTEFIFVDDGTERKYGLEIAFRARLEQAISGDFFGSRSTDNRNSYPTSTATQSLNPEQSDSIPVVLLVIEGGPNTVRTVHEAVVQNNIPVVFFEGTGRCCNLFAKAFHLYNEYRHKFDLNGDTSKLDPTIVSKRYDELKNKLHDEVKNELNAISGVRPSHKSIHLISEKKPRTTDTTDYFELVYECINTRINFLNVISLNSRSNAEPDIDLAILQALLNATSGGDPSKTSSQRKREQFHLALEWNRVDIAKNYIMKNDRDWEKVDLNDMFELALKRNQTEFVKLFLEHDFSLTEVFRNKDILPSLYMNSTRQRYDFNSMSANPLRAIYEEIIQPLIGDFFEVESALNPRKSSSHSRLDRDNHKKGCLCCTAPWADSNNDIEARVERGESFSSQTSIQCTDCHFDADKELFIWSVITGRRDFNLLFWARGKNKICAALFAALIYRKRAHKDNDRTYYQSADEFESLAVQILDRFHQANARACTKAIIRQIPAYGNVTWLELAITAEAKEFIAQRAVQDVLNNIWFGYIDQRESHKSIIFSTIMIWYSGFLRYHDKLVKTIEQTTFIDEILGKSKLSQQNQTTKSRQTKERASDDVHLRLMHGITDEASAPVAFVNVGFCEKMRSSIIRYFGNILKFIRAPYVKFLYSLYFHMIFLLIFTYMMLCQFVPLYEFQVDVCPAVPHSISQVLRDDNDKPISQVLRIREQAAITEYILAIWIFTLFCEEARQFFSSEALTLRHKLVAYLQVFWNKLDFLAIVLFYIGFILRFIPVSDSFCAARIVLAVDLALWYMRTLNIFAAVKQLGPKLVMIGEMAQDLKVYMVMLIVFILGFGVSSYCLMYNVKEFSWHLPREIINHAYWQIFGELNTLDIFENNYKANGYAVFILVIIYMAIVSILLVNLFIAMLSNTFDRVQNDTDRIWKFGRYSLICEYLSRPSLPPPFIFLSHLWRFILYALTPCIKSSWLLTQQAQHTSRTKYKIILDDKSASNIEIAEDAIGDEVYYNYLKTGRKLVDENATDEERAQSPQEILFNKVRALEDRIQIMNNHQAHVFEYLDCIMDGIKTMGGEQIKTPDRHRFDPDEPYNEISNNNDDQSKQNSRRDNLRQSSVHSDDSISPIINLFPTNRRME